MSRRNRSLGVLRMMLAVAVAACGTAAARGEQVSFTAGPKAERAADGATVSFTVSAPTDVEVAILDSDGTVVRHLAAGVLGGPNPPPEPLKPGLEQSLTWDGQDDLGEPAGAGPFTVRVRAGMGVRFGRLIGGSPYTGAVVAKQSRAPVNGLVVDEQGNLYAKIVSSVGSHGDSGLWPWHVRKFDRRGTYLKTILPYPPSTPPEKAQAFALLNTPDGSFTPANQSSLYGVLYVLGNEITHRMVDGRIVFTDSENRRLNLLKPDASGDLRTVAMWPVKSKVNSPQWLDIKVALSPDGKYAYYSNLAGTVYDGKSPSDIDPRWPQGRVYRHDLSRPDTEPEPFFDLALPDFEKQKYWMPNAWNGRTAAAGIDTDAEGNVLVCDLVNHEVVEVSPEGKRLTATKVPWPDQVVVSRKTGALYVVTRKGPKMDPGPDHSPRLYKITGRGPDAKVAAELALRGAVGGSCALDETDSPPVLWLAGTSWRSMKHSRDLLIRVEDRGAELAITGDDFLNKDQQAIAFVGYMDVDREAELVYVTDTVGNVWRYEGKTGEGGLIGIKTFDLAVGPAGHLYAWGSGSGAVGKVVRVTRDLKPAPLPGLNSHIYGHLRCSGGRGARVCGIDVDKQGRVYAAWGVNIGHVRVYGTDGQLVDFPQKITLTESGKEEQIPAAVDYFSGYGGSLRVDPAGNIYLLQYGRPKGFQPPSGYQKDPAYLTSVGTILKFGPTGARRKTPLLGASAEIGKSDPLAYDGLLGLYPGCAPLSRWRCAGACLCTKPRFDVDDFGRLYIPNAITFKVSVRDNANNEIVCFGAYGNFDCQGPDSIEPKPEIPLGWPVTAGASDKYIYVGDCLNHRLVRVDKTFAAEAVCDVK